MEGYARPGAAPLGTAVYYGLLMIAYDVRDPRINPAYPATE